MKINKIKTTDSPIEYVPVINKQLRWIACRELAERIYHSNKTDDEIKKMLDKFIPIIDKNK